MTPDQCDCTTTTTEENDLALETDTTVYENNIPECINCYVFSDRENESEPNQSSAFIWLILLVLTLIICVAASLAYLAWTQHQSGHYYVSMKGESAYEDYFSQI